MLSIPKQQMLTNQIQTLKNKAVDRYFYDLSFQQDINDAFLIMKMVEKNNVIPSFRMGSLKKAKKLMFDVKLLTVPDAVDLSNINDSVANIISKLEQIALKPIAANLKMIGAQQRINQNLPKFLNKAKKHYHIQDDKTAVTPRAAQSFITLIAPILLANKIKMLKLNQSLKENESNSLNQFLRSVMEVSDLNDEVVENFVNQIVVGDKILPPEQGKHLVSEITKQINKLNHQDLPVEWQVVLEQDNEKGFDLLIQNKTEEISQLLNNEMYRSVINRELDKKPLTMGGNF